MKKIFGLIVFIAFSATVFSQVSKNDYLEKSKRKKTTGIVLLTIGVAAITGGILANESRGQYSSFEQDFAGGLLIGGGIASGLVSIPFFISANKYKKKAATVSVNNLKIFLSKNNQLVNNFQPMISLKINM
ncbi:hypothetical protein LK994_08510 [Ferruginibacter lapsinanis]|uniref:hypothetical protein n=1 Tax=Ferruginibacter lapsinanis TaxID=563172 RepID=UPI001E6518D3|nr:hypothetical protein [Ferruginibacter lapsinanis]UEG48677.1 hypothetical protein LK994_08510 [Ferruginibacter lapsinanis]